MADTDNRGTETDTEPTIRVSLELRGFSGTPEDVSRVLGIEPTRSGEAGQTYHTVRGTPTDKRLQHSHWSLWSTVPRRAPLDAHVRSILDQLENAGDRLKDLPTGTVRTLVCTVIPEGPLPIFRLDATLLEGLGHRGIELALDVVSVGKD